ncbi:hypothetical protein [Rufibacter hautae]|uniref:Uncharacterized protein n=1 Tax=Rufibacter hautae TaxID=2595005 RepID=A0A5B6TDZ7_9BACT|nr:hypothetical protein [Rufibacter hautae]KAA3437604.1 hypothetical protein FOA19_09835 [Rufibacter hautae]
MIYLIFTSALIAYIITKASEIFNKLLIKINTTKDIKGNINFTYLENKVATFIQKYTNLEKPDFSNIKFLKWKLGVSSGLSKFFGILCIVSLIFSILQYWLDHTTNIDLAKSSILKIEQTQFLIKKHVDFITIPPLYNIVAIIILISLSIVFPILEQYKNKYNKITKYTSNIAYILTISSSFTFFGNTFKESEKTREGNLEIHKLAIIENNKLALKEIKNELRQRIINEILTNPEFSSVLHDLNEIQKEIENTESNNEYIHYVNIAPNLKIQQLPVYKFKNTFKYEFDIENEFISLETKFWDEYVKNQTSETFTDFYTEAEEASYRKFKNSNSKWHNNSSLKNSNSILNFINTEIKDKTAEKNSYLYSKYKEPIDKLIKKGYGSSAKPWLNNFIQALGLDFIFIDEFLDPILHDPIEDYITNKSENILTMIIDKDYNKARSEIDNFIISFKAKFSKDVTKSKKFNNLKTRIKNGLTLSRNISTKTLNTIYHENILANLHLEKISNNCRWEKIRKTFYNQADNLRSANFTYDQISTLKESMKEWNNYKKSSKLQLYFNGEQNLELTFHEFLKNNPKAKACWGYILQQHDWDGAAYYYTKYPNSEATGKPYYLLNYYYKTNLPNLDIREVYDEATDKWVGELCPPAH